MYELLVMELHFQLQSKQVYVKWLKRSLPTYIRRYESINVHPQLGNITHPCAHHLLHLTLPKCQPRRQFFFFFTI